MGLGDELMATGMARGAKKRGKRIAFGDGKRLVYSPWSAQIFKGNPNIVQPGTEFEADVEWIPHYKGHRLYANQGSHGWIWIDGFRPIPGEMFFDEAEIEFAETIPRGFVLIEPHVKKTAGNKQWPPERYAQVARMLLAHGYHVRQFDYGSGVMRGVEPIATANFRQALAALGRAALFVGPEGGLHHGAAAVEIPAVVIFGGFIHPRTTGYDTHVNLFSGEIACGLTSPCPHCRRAMDAITVDEVWAAAQNQLSTIPTPKLEAVLA